MILILDILTFISLGKQNGIIEKNNEIIIVVLTGENRRLEDGFKLLEEKYAKKLFISGVNPIVTTKDLKKILNKTNSTEKNLLFECCVHYEKKSKNTKTNAIETSKWLKKNNFKEIILVTSFYHMPRSIYEFRKNAPKIIVHPWKVNNIDNTKINNIKKITLEYFKYILVRLGYIIKLS